MGIYEIATKKVYMNPKGNILKSRANKYEIGEKIKKEECEIVIDVNSQGFNKFKEKYENYGYNIVEYAYASSVFYRQLVKYEGFYLHSSVVAVDEKAYLFSADSGVGKSTHTQLWRAYFKEKAEIINDDKPAIMCKDGEVKVYGTPFCGKNDINENKSVEVKGLCFLERGEVNEIRRIKIDEALGRLYRQIIYTSKEEYMIKLLKLIDIFLNKVPVYVLKCTISEDAVKVAYEEMSK